MRVSPLFVCGCCALGLIVCLTLVAAHHTIADQVTRNLMVMTRPYRLPTGVIYDLLVAIEHDHATELADFAHRMQHPASLQTLRAAWQQTAQPTSVTLGPYRAPAWPTPGAQLVIPLRLTNRHVESRLEVIVQFTLTGWQVRAIRLPT